MSANMPSISANKAFYILLATSSIAFVGLAGVLTKTLPLNFAHVVYFCQKNLSPIIGTLPHTISFLLTFMAIAILAVGLSISLIQILKTRVFVKNNLKKRTSIPRDVKKVLLMVHIDKKIDIVKNKRKFSFCYGMLSPRICLSTGLIRSLTKKELYAVLLHEKYHLKSYDPLKIILARAAAYMFFFIPILRDVQRYYTFSKELAADNEVIKDGAKESLLKALSKLLLVNEKSFGGVAAFASVHDLEKRIEYLSKGSYNGSLKPSLINLILSAVVMVSALLIVSAPVHAVSMSDESMEHSLFICPFGSECLAACKKEFPTDRKNFSEIQLYTPMQ